MKENRCGELIEENIRKVMFGEAFDELIRTDASIIQILYPKDQTKDEAIEEY